MSDAPKVRRRPFTLPVPQVSPTPPGVPCAVLIDGSALYFASAARADGRRLSYPELSNLLVKQIVGLEPAIMPELAVAHDSIWSMWTSAAPGNPGQTKFLEFAEQRLCWHVRTSFPSQSYMVEPDTLFGIGADTTKANRLLRFDAQIAFAMGRLAQTHRLVIVSDSYSLRDPIERVNEAWGQKHGNCVLAFFGQSYDSRWRRARDSKWAPDFIDFDDYHAELFGADVEKEVSRPAAQPGQIVF